MDSLKFELLKNKEEHAQSAVASQEVREHLADFIRSKRQGSSSNQLNLIPSLTPQQQQQQQQAQNLPATTSKYQPSSATSTTNTSNQCGGGDGGLVGQPPHRHRILNGNMALVDDDHPLRKTASMPTMHIPYKAQSISRRRQMERRTTMSPLMKRKSRPRRQLLHSLDSNSTEYSSNPCILQSTSRSNARSLSQSNSPPPPHHHHNHHHHHHHQHQHQHQSIFASNNMVTSSLASQTITSSNNNNTKSLQTTSSSGLASNVFGQEAPSMISASNLNNNNSAQKIDNQLGAATGGLLASPANLQSLKQQQHLKVNEAIRKTVLNRASSRGKIANVGGSLDIEIPQSSMIVGNNADGSTASGSAAAAATAAATAGCSGGDEVAARSLRDELRQWSLDSSDLRTSTALSQMAAASRTLAWGGLHKLRLATTSDAATLRRSQSPSSSISMGLAGPNQVAGGVQSHVSLHHLQKQPQQQQINHQHQHARQQQQQQPRSSSAAGPQTASVLRLTKHCSSSSSSTSSLLSAQDSLEDSTSQAIDLSSSSEAARQRQATSLQQQQHQQHTRPPAHHHHHHQHQLVSPASASFRAEANCLAQQHQHQQQASQAALNRLNYQKVLQDSFNQLQLCQSQESLKRILLPSGQQNQVNQDGIKSARSTSSSSATPCADMQITNGPTNEAQHLFASLSNQFNLSASAQNLIALQEKQLQLNTILAQQQQQQQHHHHHHHHQQQQQQTGQPFDMNNWNLIYSQLMQSPEYQQSNQITSALFTKLTELPEPYRSEFLGRLLSSQQLQQSTLGNLNQVANSGSNTNNGQPSAYRVAGYLNAIQDNQQQPLNLDPADQRSIIGRALSSPLLSTVAKSATNMSNQVAFNNSNSNDSNNIEIPMQSIEFDRIEVRAQQQQQQALGPDHSREHMNVDLFVASNFPDDNDDDVQLTGDIRDTSGANDNEDESSRLLLASKLVDGTDDNDNNNNNMIHAPERRHVALRQQQQQQQQQHRGELLSKAKSKSLYTPSSSDTITMTTTNNSSNTNTTTTTINNNNMVQHSLDLSLSSLTTTTTNPPPTGAHQPAVAASALQQSDKRGHRGAASSRDDAVVVDADDDDVVVVVDSNNNNNNNNSSSSHDNQSQAAPLNFTYLPPASRDPSKVNCSFIYNPIFDQSSSTGIIYELGMCKHKCICRDETNHPENSLRILAIWRRLFDRGLLTKCARIEGRQASLDELQLCHGETYSNYFGMSPYERIKLSKLDLSKLPIEGLTQLECGGQGADIDTAWNEEQTPAVARLAAGCVIEAAVSVAEGRLMNAFAVVRPPGHHAEHQQAMGFCFFNSISIAARVLQTRYQVSRILIVDWDVHHGNGIQKLFYEDPSVLYISLHRHDKGNFFPGTGETNEIGQGPGRGFNWNIAWSDETMGDAEYMAAFRSLVMPIARDFNPSMVLVACGFDGARGHPFNFGGYDLTRACFAYMTRQLTSVANGRLVLCLEGGYQLEAICDCAESCLRALLIESNHMDRQQQQQQQHHEQQGPTSSMGPMAPSCDQVHEAELRRVPHPRACAVLHEVSNLAANYWPSVARWRNTIEMSALEAANELI